MNEAEEGGNYSIYVNCLMIAMGTKGLSNYERLIE